MRRWPLILWTVLALLALLWVTARVMQALTPLP